LISLHSIPLPAHFSLHFMHNIPTGVK
jgi:hypothetical protein